MSYLNLLIVEDNLINQKVIAAMLGAFEFNLIFAASGEEALIEFEKQKIDLILMDYQLPKMSGIDTTIEIRKIENAKMLNKTIIVALTAEVFKETEVNCIKAGMDAFLTKPLNLQTLIQSLTGLGFNLKKRGLG